jgi:hypothetical protein
MDLTEAGYSQPGALSRQGGFMKFKSVAKYLKAKDGIILYQEDPESYFPNHLGVKSLDDVAHIYGDCEIVEIAPSGESLKVIFK